MTAVVGMPPASGTEINEIDVVAGRLPDPARDDQVVVEVLDRHTLAGRFFDRRHDTARYPAAQQPLLGVAGSRPLIDAGRHQLAILLPTEPVFVDGDPMRLAQVV